VVVGAAVGQALHTGQVVLTFLAGDALLSPDRLTSDPHGHGGHVVVGATVVGLGVNWTGGAVVVGAAVVVVGAAVDGATVGQALQTGQAVLALLAGDALLSPDKLASDPHGHGAHVVVGATVVVGLGVN